MGKTIGIPESGGKVDIMDWTHEEEVYAAPSLSAPGLLNLACSAADLTATNAALESAISRLNETSEGVESTAEKLNELITVLKRTGVVE